MPLPWERTDVPSAFTLHETARRIGCYRWVELRLYEAMGGWVPSIPEPDVQVAVGSRCGVHASHARVWLECLPAGGGVDPESVTAPANGAVAALLDTVASATGTVERLVGVYRVVVPRLVAAYTAHLNHTSAAADGPIAGSLRVVLDDETREWRDGELLVQSLIAGGGDVRRAADHQARAEALAAQAGGLAGPGTLDPRGVGGD